MSKSLSNVLKGTYTASLPASGNTGNILISSAGGWISSTLPTANTTTLGGVKVDGTTIIANNGIISGASTYTLPTANTTTLGGVKVDGTTIIANNGVISANVSSGASATKTIANKTAAYTVVADDLGRIINCTSGTFTVSLTAAATLGSGFTCTIWNTSSTATDVITIDPAGTETFDGSTTWKLVPGKGTDIVCNGTNWISGAGKNSQYYAECALPGGYTNDISAGASGAVAIAPRATALSVRSLAIGYLTSAGSTNSSAIGVNSVNAGSITASGSGAMALGGSYASGTDSFAAAIASNSANYGATGANSVAIGQLSRATGNYSVAIGIPYNSNGNFSTGIASYTFGDSCWASGVLSFAFGAESYSQQFGKYTYASGKFSARGDNQYGLMVLRAATTTTTAAVLTSNYAVAGTTNQLIVASDQAMTFFGTLIAKQSASANMASYLIKGAIVNNAGTVSISTISIDKIIDTIGLTTEPTYTADNTNKALTVTSGAKATTNIRWVCNLNSVEVTYA